MPAAARYVERKQTVRWALRRSRGGSPSHAISRLGLFYLKRPTLFGLPSLELGSRMPVSKHVRIGKRSSLSREERVAS